MENKYNFELSMFETADNCNLDTMYNPCDLQIIMKTGRPLPEDALIDFYLYDDTYTLMGFIQQDKSPTAYVVEGCKVDVLMDVRLPWTEGKYTLLANVRTPAGKPKQEEIQTVMVNMVLQDYMDPIESDCDIHIVNVELCKGITPEVALAQRLNNDASPAWCGEHFQRFVGIKPLKQWIIRRKQWEMVDGLLDEGKPNPIKYCNNYMLTLKAKTSNYLMELAIYLKLVAFRDFEKTTINCERLYDELTPASPYHRLNSLFTKNDASADIITTAFGIMTQRKEIYFIYNVGILSTAKGKPILKELMWNIMSNSPDRVIVIAGTEQEINDLMQAEPALRVYFPSMGRAEAGALTYPEILHYMYSWIKIRDMRLNRAAEAVLKSDIKRGWESGMVREWTITDIENYVVSTLKSRYTERVSAGIDISSLLSQTSDILVDVNDLDRSYFLGGKAEDWTINFDDDDEEDTPPDLPKGEEEDEEEPVSPSSGELEEDDSFERLLNSFINDPDFGKEKKEETTPDLPDDDDIPSPFGLGSSSDDADDDDNPLREPKVRLQILPPLRNPKEEMDKLVGCQDIKQRIEQLTMMSRYNRMMRTANPEGKRHELALHSIFYGRPGTGKTTVCKIMGGLLRKSGALSIGHVVVCSRKDFIGTHWGDEERVVRKAVEEAKGGVLMIDEAYQLVSENPNDPGRLVIPLLMDVLSDEKQRDIAIVLCGYKDEMKKLIDLNPGLNSRFPNVFEFKDFTIDELLEITERRVKEYGYEFTRAAWRKYRGIIEDAYKVRDANTWGNARFIANLLDKIYLNHAMRCVKKSGMDRRHLLQITPADVQPIEVAKPKPHFGF
ncbi:MAG: AAA family ATPase [Prevotella sp.]|nr:AAA family ATPase [Prevotella sp.]